MSAFHPKRTSGLLFYSAARRYQTKVGIIGSDAILVAGTIEETAATILAG